MKIADKINIQLVDHYVTADVSFEIFARSIAFAKGWCCETKREGHRAAGTVELYQYRWLIQPAEGRYSAHSQRKTSLRPSSICFSGLVQFRRGESYASNLLWSMKIVELYLSDFASYETL